MMKLLQTATQTILARPLNVALFAILAAAAGYLLSVSLPNSMEASANGTGALLAPPAPIALAGHEVYYQEGCQYCHTMNLRPFAWETARFAKGETYGLYPLPQAAEYRFESPYVRGSRRIGPDLSRLAGRYDAGSLEALLKSKGDGKSLAGDVHTYAYLFAPDSELYPLFLSWKIRAMINGGALFSDPYQKSVFEALEGRTRGEALVEYLLSRGQKQATFAGGYYQK